MALNSHTSGGLLARGLETRGATGMTPSSCIRCLHVCHGLPVVV